MLDDLLASKNMSLETFMELEVDDECSKSVDESCINSECEYNFVKIHDDELYKKVYKKIVDKRNGC